MCPPPPGTGRTCALGVELVGHVQQWEQRHQAVVTIGLDEVVPRDGCGVDVVLPEGADKGLQGAGRR